MANSIPGSAEFEETIHRSSLKVLNDFAVEVMSIVDEVELAWYVAREVVGKLGFVDCVVYFIDDEKNMLRQVSAIGDKNPQGNEISCPLEIPVGSGITGYVADTGQATIVGDLSLDSRYIPDVEPALSEICVPLISGDKVLGVIDCEDRRSEHFEQIHLELLTTVSALTSSKLDLLRKNLILRESEQNYRAIVEDQSEMINRHLPDGTRTFVNDSYCKFHGKSREELLGQSAYEGMESDALKQLKSLYGTLTPENPTGIFETSIHLPNGNISWQLWTKRAIFDETEHVTEYQAVGHDITTRKQAENRLTEAMESFSSGFALYDKDDRIVLFNSHYKKKLDADAPGTLKIGRTFEEMLNDWITLGAYNVPEHERAEFVAERMRVHRSAPNQFEAQFKGGRWALVSEYKTSGGEIAVIITDISERKKIEEALTGSEARLTEIIDIAPEAVITIDGEMCIQLFNKGAERIFGYSADEVIGRKMEFLMPERSRLGHHKHIEGFDYSSDTYRLMDGRDDIAGLRKDGIEFSASASVSKLETSSGKIYTVMLQDVTERRKSENERRQALVSAEKANQAKSDFLATMSHELRTPLNAIIGFSEMIEGQYFGPLGSDKYSEYAHDIRDSSEHLLSLINDILDLSAVEAGKHPLVKEELNIENLIANCTPAIVGAAAEKNITFTIEAPDGLQSLHADRRAITQILINLLSNAVKYTLEGGTITLSVTATEKAHTFVVKDTGIGVPDDKLSSITDPFVRTETDPHKPQEGTGLGLSIVKSLVDLHGGELDIQSEVGVGTIVTVKFPSNAI